MRRPEGSGISLPVVSTSVKSRLTASFESLFTKIQQGISDEVRLSKYKSAARAYAVVYK